MSSAMDEFLSYLYWLQMNLDMIASHILKTTLLVFCVVHGDKDVHKKDYLKIYINPLDWHCRIDCIWTQ